jgi:hypothetical protein
MEEIAAAIPEDLVTLRPEDIRVEAEFVDLVVTASEPENPARPPVIDVSIHESRQPTEPLVLEGPLAPSSSGPPEVAVVAPTTDPGPPAVNSGSDPILSGISIEPPSILPRGREIRQVREVVLQPATVLAWSLLVLLSIPMAFVAGLLIGHFMWK